MANKAHRRLWTWSCRGAAPSCHSGNTNCFKHQTGGKVTALNSADVHGFGNKLHYPKVECRVCPGLSTQELSKWLHSSVLRKYSLTKRAVPNCSILFPRYSLVYIGVERYSKRKKKIPERKEKTKSSLVPTRTKAASGYQTLWEIWEIIRGWSLISWQSRSRKPAPKTACFNFCNTSPKPLKRSL